MAGKSKLANRNKVRFIKSHALENMSEVISENAAKAGEYEVGNIASQNTLGSWNELDEWNDTFGRIDHKGHSFALIEQLKSWGAPRSLIEKVAPANPFDLRDYELSSAIAQSLHTDRFEIAEILDAYLDWEGYSLPSRKAGVVAYESLKRSGNAIVSIANAAHAFDPTQPSIAQIEGEFFGVTPYDYPQNTPLYDLDALNAFLAQNRMAGEHVNAVAYAQHMPSYARLQAQLQRAGAPASLLESLAKGSGASAFNKSGVNPSMAAAMMRGLEGASVVNDVRFSALDKLAGEHARLEYERTGDAVAATQAGVDAVRAAKEANTGQAPLSGLSNEQVAEKAVQGYRDSLMKGTLQIDQYGRVTRGSLADKNPNYAGPSHEFSPEDYMTFEQNQQQLARNEAKRLAAKTQREAPKATAKVPPKTPRTVTINVPRQDYLSGQTEQGAARAARSKIDTTGLNVDLLNKAVPKTRPGQYEVTLGGWSPVGGSPAAVQKTAPKPKSDPDLLAAAQRTDRQLAQQARINKAAAQVRAREDGLLSDTSKASRASAKEDTLDDADFAVDKTLTANAAKVEKLGESVKVKSIDLLGENAISRAQEEQERREQNVRQRREKSGQTSNDNVSSIGAGSQAGRDAASQISMGETSGRSTGYNDRQDLATALSRSGQHGDVGVSNLTSHGTIRGSQ